MTEVLEWHRAAAVEIENADWPWNTIAESIARHDPSAELLRECAKALTEIVEWFDTEYFVKPKSCGMCGLPNSNCDYECVSAAGFSKDMALVRTALSRLAEAGVRP